MNLLDYAKIVEPCQRNWDEEFVIPDEHIQYILDVCTTMPTKNNRNVYSLIVIKNKTIIEMLYSKAAYDPHNWRNTFMRNSQVNANALLLWCAGTEKIQSQSDRDIAIGISSGSAALAAAELGYKTGFCKCFAGEIVTKILRKNKIKSFNRGYLMLGIGKPNNKYDRKVPVIDGIPQRPRPSHGKKDILVRQID